MIQSEQHIQTVKEREREREKRRESDTHTRIEGKQEEGNDTKKPRKSTRARQEVHEGEKDWIRPEETAAL